MRRRFEGGSQLKRRAVLALLAALAVGGLVMLPALDLRLEPSALLPESPELDETDRLLHERFGDPPGPVLLVRLRAPDVLQPDVLREIHRLTLALQRHEGVARVRGPTTIPLPVPLPPSDEARADAELDALLTLVEAHPETFPDGLVSVAAATGGPTSLGRPFDAGPARAPELIRQHRDQLGPLLSDDGSSALLIVSLSEGTPWREGLLDDALRSSGNLDLEVTGAPILEDALGKELAGDAPLLIALAMLGNGLVLLFAMRSRRGLMLPMGAAGISLAIVFLVMTLAGRPFTLLHAMLPPLLLTVAISDAIHILFRHRENLREQARGSGLGRNGWQVATERTMRDMAGACFITSVTTAAGFGALGLAHTPAVRELAIWAVVGVAIAYLVTLLFVIASLGTSRVRPSGRGRTAARIAQRATRRPWISLGIWIAIGVAGFALGSRVERGSKLLAPFPEDLAAAQVARSIERDHGGTRHLVAIAPDAATSRALTDWLGASEDIAHVASGEKFRSEVFAMLSGTDATAPTDEPTRAALGVLAGPLLEGWEADDGSQRIEISLRDISAERVMGIIDELDSRGASAVGGEAARASMAVATIQEDLARTFGFAIVTIFLFVGFLLRSLRLGLISVLPNLLPIGVGVGWMALRGIALDASTAMVFAATLGLAVDGTVHALVRFKGHRDVGRTFREAGPGILVGGATLLAGFAALFATDLPPVRHFAELATVTLFVATLAELTLLPVLLRLFGRAQESD